MSMRFRALVDQNYWIEEPDLRLTSAAAIPAGRQSWVYDAVTASPDAYRAFLGQAVAAGLPQATADRVLHELGFPKAAA